MKHIYIKKKLLIRSNNRLNEVSKSVAGENLGKLVKDSVKSHLENSP